MNRRQFSLSALLTAFGSAFARAEETLHSNFNLPLATSGGLYYWGDVSFFQNYRIQKSSITGHYRLLDDRDVRKAWGSLETCQAKLAELRVEESLAPMSGEAVIVMHGLNRNRRHMRHIEGYLNEKGGYQVFNMGYPSSQGGVDDHAKQLDGVIDSLEGIERIHFVAHSLGNLVVRRWMKLNSEAETPDQRLGRIVMLGPPNHSPVMARILVPIDFKNIIAGQAGRDLGCDWCKLEPNLATPTGEFGIIAGGKNDNQGWNPLIAGDDDTTVGVDEAKLTGAADFRVLRVLHPNMPYEESIQAMTLAFLKQGRFGSEAERQRIG